MASCTCSEGQRVTSTAQTCTGWTWPPGSGSTSSPTTLPTTCLRNGTPLWLNLNLNVLQDQTKLYSGVDTDMALCVSQVQAWNSTWRTEDLHSRRRNFLDILPSGQGTTPLRVDSDHPEVQNVSNANLWAIYSFIFYDSWSNIWSFYGILPVSAFKFFLS